MTISQKMIILTQTIVTANTIHVSSCHTSYASQKRLIFPNLLEIKQSLKELRKMAKEKNISLQNTTKVSKEITELESSALKEYSDYSAMFDEYFSFWKSIDLGNGLNSKVANSLDYSLRNNMDQCLWRSTKLSQYVEVCHSILRAKENVSRGFGKAIEVTLSL